MILLVHAKRIKNIIKLYSPAHVLLQCFYFILTWFLLFLGSPRFAGQERLSGIIIPFSFLIRIYVIPILQLLVLLFSNFSSSPLFTNISCESYKPQNPQPPTTNQCMESSHTCWPHPSSSCGTFSFHINYGKHEWTPFQLNWDTAILLSSSNWTTTASFGNWNDHRHPNWWLGWELVVICMEPSRDVKFVDDPLKWKWSKQAPRATKGDRGIMVSGGEELNLIPLANCPLWTRVW